MVAFDEAFATLSVMNSEVELASLAIQRSILSKSLRLPPGHDPGVSLTGSMHASEDLSLLRILSLFWFLIGIIL